MRPFLSLAGILALVLAMVVTPTAALGSELRVGVGADSYKLTGDAANLGFYPLNANIFETLVVLTPEFELAPGLAVSWENTGGNTWRFYLRKGVRFHDGSPLTAADVKYSLDRVARTGGIIPANEDSVKVIDDYTIEITPSLEVFNRVPENLSHPSYSILREGTNPGEKPVGTGPFRFESYTRNQEIVVTKNPDYWGQPARVDRISFKFMPDGTARSLALQAGAVDVVTALPKELVPFLAGLKGFRAESVTPAVYVALYLTTKTDGANDVLKDRRLRQAINYALDRQSIVEAVWGGFAQPAKTLVPPVIPEVDASVEGFSYNPAMARALIEEAGWRRQTGGSYAKDGKPLELTFLVGFPPARIVAPLQEIIKDQLEAVGFVVDLVEYNDIGAYYDRLAEGDAELVLEQGAYNTADPSFIPYNLFWSENTWGESGLFYYWFFVNPAYDAAVRRSVSTRDEQEAIRATAEAMRIQVDEFVGVAPIAYVKNTYIMAEHVKGLQVHPSALNQSWVAVRVER